MGKSSKPLTIFVDASLYEVYKDGWIALSDQGYTIRLIEGELPDLYLAPYAMRMTADMLTQLPMAFTLAVKGARALRYAPHGVTIKKGTSNAKAKGAPKRKHTAKQVETVNTSVANSSPRESAPPRDHQGVAGIPAGAASAAPHSG